MTTSPQLTVATFNIKLGMQQGLAAIADVVKQQDGADILAVQEIGINWLMGPEGNSPAQLAEMLELTHFQFVPTIEETRSDGSGAYYGHALFSRWPLQNRELIDLPRNEDEPRRLFRCQIDTGGGTVEILSTHLSHLPSDRPDQGIFLRTWLDDHPLQTDARFLLGDLNAPPSETWISDFLNHWQDADGDSGRPTFPAHDPQRRIDYVLAQGAGLRRCTVPPLSDVSDHRPVISRWDIAAD